MSYEQFRLLLQQSDDAYARARKLVYDHLAPGVTPDQIDLTEEQRAALHDLDAAEQALKRFRSNAAGSTIDLVATTEEAAAPSSS